MILSDVPWRVVRKSFYTLRSKYFTVPVTRIDFKLPQTTISELRTILKKEHFGNGVFFSYNYKGEDLNMYRPEYRNDEWGQYQTHVRAFRKTTDKGEEYCEVECHFELDPRASGQARAHLDEVNFSKSIAIENLKIIFNRHAIEYVR